MQCGVRVRVYPVSIREHGQAAGYFYCLVFPGPMPETTADSMRPYILSHTTGKQAGYINVCGVYECHVTIILICRGKRNTVHLGYVVCKYGRSETVRMCVRDTQHELESSDSTQPLPTQT